MEKTHIFCCHGIVMKRLLSILYVASLWIVFSNNACSHEQAEDYRFNLFQYKLPEYFFKAKPEKLDSITQLPKNYKEIKISGYSFYIPKSYKIKNEDFELPTVSARDKNNKSLFFIMKEKAKHLLCSDPENEKDYCSVFDTRRSLLTKSYTLTPDDLSKPEYASKGYSWIIFYKGISFEYVKEIKMYERDGFVFFRENVKPSSAMKKLKIGIAISSPRNDELLNLVMLVNDEKILMDILKSFRLSSN